MKKAPLKMGPKGPMTGGGPLNATKMADYRQRLREQQENALKLHSMFFIMNNTYTL